MNENPRMLFAFCLEKYNVANRPNMLANMLVQMLVNMLARFAGAFKYLFSTAMEIHTMACVVKKQNNFIFSSLVT